MLKEVKNNICNFFVDVIQGIENYYKSNSDLPCELFKYIPIVKIGNDARNVYISFRDFKLYQKIKRLIDKIDPKLEGIKLISKFKNEKDQKRLCESLIKNLDNINDDLKVDLMINLFQAFLVDKISYEEFMRFSHIVDSCFYDDLKWLKNFMGEDYINNNIHIQGLVGTSLIIPGDQDWGIVGSNLSDSGQKYKRSPNGEKFCKYALHFQNPLEISI